MNQESSDIQRTEISEYGEFGLIERLTQNFKTYSDSTLKGIGDDAAVIKNQESCTVITTDMMVEGVHFDLAYFPLKHLGYKSIISNLSDIYAMNAIPEQVTVSIAVSNRFSVEALEVLYEGIRQACIDYKVDLIGGDTTASLRGLVISVTAIGRQVEPKISYRSGAKSGDYIFVTGELGAAYLGLQLLEREKQVYLSTPGVQPNLEDQKYLVGKFLKPDAKKETIEWLEKIKVIPTAMIDLSDGLSSDLKHLCKQSQVGAEIIESLIPMHLDAKMMALKFHMDPLTCALNGGEDYELLFTVSPQDSEKVKFIPDLNYIGEIKDASFGVMLKGNTGNLHALKAQGWTHF
ncbi:MAG: thiamine-phosphate kinase [Saprospiraceae bacterium]|nr:thiamine-phosphate kinase [Saprospiraceae bacterium]MBK9222638.1 thiamine-phosphate kinase [Saprospiraceae bacterium]